MSLTSLGHPKMPNGNHCKLALWGENLVICFLFVEGLNKFSASLVAQLVKNSPAMQETLV